MFYEIEQQIDSTYAMTGEQFSCLYPKILNAQNYCTITEEIRRQAAPMTLLVAKPLEAITVLENEILGNKMSFPFGFAVDDIHDCRFELGLVISVLQNNGLSQPSIAVQMTNHHPLAFYEPLTEENDDPDNYLMFDFPTAQREPYPRVECRYPRLMPYMELFEQDYEYTMGELLQLTDLLLLYNITDQPESKVDHFKPQVLEAIVNAQGINVVYREVLLSIR